MKGEGRRERVKGEGGRKRVKGEGGRKRVKGERERKGRVERTFKLRWSWVSHTYHLCAVYFSLLYDHI